jgi:hypothetical protein
MWFSKILSPSSGLKSKPSKMLAVCIASEKGQRVPRSLDYMTLHTRKLYSHVCISFGQITIMYGKQGRSENKYKPKQLKTRK